MEGQHGSGLLTSTLSWLWDAWFSLQGLCTVGTCTCPSSDGN